MDIDIDTILETLIIITVIAGAFVFAISLTTTEVIVSDTFSDFNIKRGYLSEIVSAPCLNDVILARPERRKYIFDPSNLDREQEGIPTISCLNISTTKYRVYVKDMSTGDTWLFTNYMPSKYTYDTYKTPEIDQLIQINNNDRYNKALVSASFTLGEHTDKIPDEIFCERDPSDREYISGSTLALIEAVYRYPDSSCNSSNCIKGPGQSYATCQPKDNTYDKTGSCEKDQQCRSSKCEEGRCTTEAPPGKIQVGQLCMDIPGLTREETCETGYCKYDIICACRDNNDCGEEEECSIEKGICL